MQKLNFNRLDNFDFLTLVSYSIDNNFQIGVFLLAFFSENVENELLKAIDEKEQIMFVVNGKQVTIEAGECVTKKKSRDSLVVVIDCNSELKASLYRYIGDASVLK